MKSSLFFLLVFLSSTGWTQVILENNPTGLRWSQINTPNFRVIFPTGFDQQAQRVANTLEHIRTPESQTMGTEPRRISIVLQNQSSVSNGFVSMFPRRSEFYTMPSQNYNLMGTNDWLDILSTHEYRHIVQYQHATTGFNKLLYFLFGLPTMSGMAHVAAPNWFWEGDAVATETAFTPSGRGKIPNFGLVFRTNLLEGRSFNYHKQYLRSYKHEIPDHYVFGYHMVSYLRRRTNDPDIWEKITHRSWSVPFIPFAFSNAIRNKTGFSVTKLYREMAKDLRREWQNQIDTLKLTRFETLTRRVSSRYTDYLYPQPQPDGSVLAMKTGIGDIEQFVLLKDGDEKKVFTPGLVNDAGMLSTTGNVIVWNEYGYDPRWQVKNFSLIKAYDREKKTKVVVSDRESRFGSASLSPDGKHIVTVRSTTEYKHSVVIITYPEGNIIKEFPNPENSFYATPRWSADGQLISVVKTSEKGKTISVLDPESGSERELWTPNNENIGHPVLSRGFLFFNAPYSGIDNIFVFELESGRRSQVTVSRYGAYNAVVSPDGKFIYYNDQSANGLDVVRIPFDPALWKPFVEPVSDGLLYEHLVEQEGHPGLLRDVPSTAYPVTRYSKWKHLINPFAWGIQASTDLARVNVGIESQDILSTTSLNAGYTFDLTERTGYWRAGLSYQGLYPIIDLNVTQGKRSVDEDYTTTIINGGESTTTTDTYDFSWTERTFSGGLRLPLNLTRSKYVSSLAAAYNIGVITVSDFDNDFPGYNQSRFIPAVIENGEVKSGYLLLDYITNGNFAYNNLSVSGYRLLKQSKRDILSRWGQAFNIEYYDTPFGGDLNGGLFSATGYLYFPGLFRHHVLHGYVAYQKTMISENTNINDYLFRNTVPLPRGINDYVSRFRTFTSASVNYTFPIWYPDIAIGPVLNVQRVRGTLFTDVAAGENSLIQHLNDNFVCVGGELKFDINIMRFLPQIDLGVRYSYGIDPSVSNFELIIGTFNF
jgi:hypothetical protein